MNWLSAVGKLKVWGWVFFFFFGGVGSLLGQVAPDSSAQAVEALQGYLAKPRAERPGWEEQGFRDVALTRADAKRARQLLWEDHRDWVKQDRAAEVASGKLTSGQFEMPFTLKKFGEKPDDGWSLYISMHGGGSAPARVNERQWKNQQRLYELKEGIYVCPRAPTDSWNMWHQAHIDVLYQRLIADLIVLEEVNPNRVYILGYSAGGDGVYQLAPRMADFLAAAAMMAGHPNETSPLGLRNLPFTLHMGGKDGAYNRNAKAEEWKKELARLRSEDPGGYLHEVVIHPEKGHWMDKQDAVALDWMSRHTRNPRPNRIVWKQDDVTHPTFYWLAANETQPRSEIRAEIQPSRIALETDDANQVRIRLDDRMLPLDEELSVTWNGQQVYQGKATRRIDTLYRTLREREDPELMFPAEIVVDKKDR